MYNVDIDTGGTMTDGLVSGDGSVVALKVETTPHDVTIAFTDLLEAARAQLGFGDLRSFLDQVEVIRWSSTITSNALAQRIGPKLGLLVSAGHEKDLYDSEGVLLLPELQRVDGKRIVLFRGEAPDGTTGRELMRATLLARGARVDGVTCYRRAKPTFDVAGLLEQWRAGRVDAVIVTSAEVLDNFVGLIGDVGRRLLDATPVFVPHPRIAEHARGQGLCDVVTTAPTDAGLLAGLLDHFRDAVSTHAPARPL